MYLYESFHKASHTTYWMIGETVREARWRPWSERSILHEDTGTGIRPPNKRAKPELPQNCTEGGDQITVETNPHWAND